MTTTALFVNVHKGASTYVADELGPAVAATDQYASVVSIGSSILRGKTFADLRVPPEGWMATRIYPSDLEHLIEDPEPVAGRFAGKRIVVMWRDPRDAAISLYFSRAYSHGTGVRDPERLRADREELREMGLYRGVLERTARPAIREFLAIREFAARHPDALTLSYEQLIADPAGALLSIASHLEWAPATVTAVERATRNSFVPPTADDPFKHKRRMTPGNWREIVDPPMQRLFDRLAGEQLSEAGYQW